MQGIHRQHQTEYTKSKASSSFPFRNSPGKPI
uniref:Uncharacterized protein n=1 Tax=Anguilla anguilla TaxID=7936 RepID=A0A0E9XM41_ANGAN